MVRQLTSRSDEEQASPFPNDVIYPDSDGKPLSDNTKQYLWIVLIKEGIEWLFVNDPNVFVAGDLLWYPLEGSNKIRIGPDVLVAFGRPKCPIELEGTQPDFDLSRVVDREVRADLPDQTITKILRRGFRLGEKILRPTEVITSKTE